MVIVVMGRMPIPPVSQRLTKFVDMQTGVKYINYFADAWVSSFMMPMIVLVEQLNNA